MSKVFWLGLLGSFVGMALFTGMSFWFQDVFTVDRNGTVDFRISTAGNIGIGSGSDNPQSRLLVRSSGTGTTSSALDVQASNGTSRLFVRDDGNVGVGTTSPGYKMDVYGNLHLRTTYGFIVFDSTSEGFTYTSWYTPRYSNSSYSRNTSAWEFGLWTETSLSSDDRMYFGRSGVSAVDLVINKDGRVGVGRIPSTNIFEVEGNASKTASGSWLANSDRRIKNDIRDLEHPLDVINALHPVKFRYTEEYRMKHPSIRNHDYVNFIAQEFQQVFPDSVQDDGTGLLQIDIHNVTPYLVAAVQAQQRQIEALKDELARLKK